MGIASGSIPLVADESSFPPSPPVPPSDENIEGELNRRAAVPIVLLVEDNSADVYVIDLVLKGIGIPIDLRVASDGEQALAILKRSEESRGQPQPSVILLDWNLPRISGAEVLAYARKSERWRNVPVVVVTSTNSPVDVREIRHLGATEHFRKPTDLDAYLDLKRIVLNLLPKPPQAPS